MRVRRACVVAAALVTAIGCGHEDGELDIPPEPGARAEISVEAARATALSRFASADVVSGELEEEGGSLIYSFDIRVAGQRGIEEVQVDAHDGRILSQKHETDEEEAAEK